MHMCAYVLALYILLLHCYSPEPTAVVNLSALATSSGSIDVTWDLPLYPNGPISHYVVFYKASDIIQLPPISSNGYVNTRVESTSTHLEITELEANTNYTIHVQAIVKTDNQGILLGAIDEEILVLTGDGSTSTDASDTGTVDESIIAGVVVGVIFTVLIIVATVIIIVVMVVRGRFAAVFRLKYSSR